MVWISMVVLGTLLLARDSFKSATAPWWASWLGNGLLIFGVMLPFLWLRRASTAYQEKTGPSKANNGERELRPPQSTATSGTGRSV